MAYKKKLVVCASGGGGNFQSIIDNRDKIGIEISLLIVDRVCGAIDRAEKYDIPYINISNTQSDLFQNLGIAIPVDTDLIVLAGFMPIIPKFLCEEWSNKIINTHPSLLPSYGGTGMYGVKVQEAVMRGKEKFAGCTVHFVNDVIDGGDIILQKKIKVDYSETPWELGGRVFNEEKILLVKAIKMLIEVADAV